MGFKRLPELEYSNHISNTDGLVSIVDGKVKNVTVETLSGQINTNFDISVAKNTDTEYQLNVTVGGKTITTPNLKGDNNVDEYGVRYNSTTKNPKLERVGASVGLVAETGVGADKKVVNDFDNIYPWSDMKRCTLADNGTVTSYIGEANYTENGSTGQVVTEIPKFYIKRVIDKRAGYIYRFVCKEKLPGYRLPKKFIGKNGEELDKIYVASYPSVLKDGKCSSVQGVLSSDIAYDDLETINQGHASRGENWHCIDLATLEVLQTLFIVEFATLDSRSVFSGCSEIDTDAKYIPDAEFLPETSNLITVTGEYENNHFYAGQEICIYSDNEANFNSDDNIFVDEIDGKQYCYTVRKVQDVTDEGNGSFTLTFSGNPLLLDETAKFSICYTSGCTNDVTASSGISGNGKYGCCPFVWRGIENLYGASVTLINGAVRSRTKFYITDDISQYSERPKGIATNENYHELEYKAPSKSGYISEMGYDAEYPWAVLPSQVEGTSDTAYCDSLSVNSATIGLGFMSCTLGLFDACFDGASSVAGRLVYCKYE